MKHIYLVILALLTVSEAAWISSTLNKGPKNPTLWNPNTPHDPAPLKELDWYTPIHSLKLQIFSRAGKFEEKYINAQMFSKNPTRKQVVVSFDCPKEQVVPIIAALEDVFEKPEFVRFVRPGTCVFVIAYDKVAQLGWAYYEKTKNLDDGYEGVIKIGRSRDRQIIFTMWQAHQVGGAVFEPEKRGQFWFRPSQNDPLRKLITQDFTVCDSILLQASILEY
eukprot:TRINITY_DN23226_c0_g1_i1.p2 TRINITY_DN23226_c0_g1~~TRINITY_DN23226_c0_g1_i1.p2  ORF type:complete len:221 (+),score=48.91 TRINITY_DN23226_c0_g1_i1:131-793(+)